MFHGAFGFAEGGAESRFCEGHLGYFPVASLRHVDAVFLPCKTLDGTVKFGIFHRCPYMNKDAGKNDCHKYSYKC